MEVAPARQAAYDVLRRVAEEGAYADRALRSASEGLDDRDRALARQLAFGSVQRLRTLDHAIETLGKRPVRKLDPPVLAALRLGAYQLGYLGGVPRYAAVNESVELVRRAGLERAVPFTNAVLRRVSEGIALLLFGAAGGAAEALLPGLDLGRLAPRSRRGGGARADACAERATTRRCQTRPGTVPGRGRNGHPERLRRRSRRRAGARRGPDLAAEPRLAARRARRRLAGGGARARPLCRARWEGDDARGRRHGRRGERSPGARARGERRPARRDERARRPRRRARAAAGADRLRPGSRRRAVLGPRRPRGAARPALALVAASRASARRSSARQPSARGPAARSSTPSAPSMRTRPRRWSTPPASRSSRSRAGRSSGIGHGRSSSRRCRMSTARAAFSSRACASPA